MKILGIENRDENWRTARYFAPFFEDENARARLAKQLLANHLETQPSAFSVEPSDIRINLFWYGMRDYFATGGVRVNRDLAERYERLFPNLSHKVDSFQYLQTSHTFNYNPSQGNQEDNLGNNLANTEVDVVLETPNHIFVGEAKHETGFDSYDTGDVIVHQLLRQRVMVKILLDIWESKKRVVQFVVADDKERAKNFGQVRFLIDQKWMSDQNVLTWDCIKELWQ